MGRYFTIFCATIGCLFLLVLSTQAAEVTIAWDANSESDLAGYRAYWGTASGVYTEQDGAGLITQYTITGLDEGVTYYIAVTAYDTEDNESGYSNEVTYTPSGAPDPDPVYVGATYFIVSLAIIEDPPIVGNDMILGQEYDCTFNLSTGSQDCVIRDLAAGDTISLGY